jgi:hypothetical protein
MRRRRLRNGPDRRRCSSGRSGLVDHGGGRNRGGRARRGRRRGSGRRRPRGRRPRGPRCSRGRRLSRLGSDRRDRLRPTRRLRPRRVSVGVPTGILGRLALGRQMDAWWQDCVRHRPEHPGLHLDHTGRRKVRVRGRGRGSGGRMRRLGSRGRMRRLGSPLRGSGERKVRLGRRGRRSGRRERYPGGREPHSPPVHRRLRLVGPERFDIPVGLLVLHEYDLPFGRHPAECPFRVA